MATNNEQNNKKQKKQNENVQNQSTFYPLVSFTGMNLSTLPFRSRVPTLMLSQINEHSYSQFLLNSSYQRLFDRALTLTDFTSYLSSKCDYYWRDIGIFSQFDTCLVSWDVIQKSGIITHPDRKYSIPFPSRLGAITSYIDYKRIDADVGVVSIAGVLPVPIVFITTGAHISANAYKYGFKVRLPQEDFEVAVCIDMYDYCINRPCWLNKYLPDPVTYCNQNFCIPATTEMNNRIMLKQIRTSGPKYLFGVEIKDRNWNERLCKHNLKPYADQHPCSVLINVSIKIRTQSTPIPGNYSYFVFKADRSFIVHDNVFKEIIRSLVRDLYSLRETLDNRPIREGDMSSLPVDLFRIKINYDFLTRVKGLVSYLNYLELARGNDFTESKRMEFLFDGLTGEELAAYGEIVNQHLAYPTLLGRRIYSKERILFGLFYVLCKYFDDFSSVRSNCSVVRNIIHTASKSIHQINGTRNPHNLNILCRIKNDKFFKKDPSTIYRIIGPDVFIREFLECDMVRNQFLSWDVMNAHNQFDINLLAPYPHDIALCLGYMYGMDECGDIVHGSVHKSDVHKWFVEIASDYMADNLKCFETILLNWAGGWAFDIAHTELSEKLMFYYPTSKGVRYMAEKNIRHRENAVTYDEYRMTQTVPEFRLRRYMAAGVPWDQEEAQRLGTGYIPRFRMTNMVNNFTLEQPLTVPNGQQIIKILKQIEEDVQCKLHEATQIIGALYYNKKDGVWNHTRQGNAIEHQNGDRPIYRDNARYFVSMEGGNNSKSFKDKLTEKMSVMLETEEKKPTITERVVNLAVTKAIDDTGMKEAIADISDNISVMASKVTATVQSANDKMDDIAGAAHRLTQDTSLFYKSCEEKFAAIQETFSKFSNTSLWVAYTLKLLAFGFLLSREENQSVARILSLIVLILPADTGDCLKKIAGSLNRAITRIKERLEKSNKPQVSVEGAEETSFFQDLFIILKITFKNLVTKISERDFNKMLIPARKLKIIAENCKSFKTIGEFFMGAVLRLVKTFKNMILHIAGKIPKKVYGEQFKAILTEYSAIKDYNGFEKVSLERDKIEKLFALEEHFKVYQKEVYENYGYCDIAKKMATMPLIGIIRKDIEHAISQLPVGIKNACGSRVRTTPFAIFISGNTCIGKSYLIPFLISKVVSFVGLRDNYDSPDRYTFTRNFVDKYWDGYRDQLVTFYDDIFQNIKNEEMLDTVIAEMTSVINNCDYKLNMAQLSEKANTHFTSKLVLATAQKSFHQLSFVKDRTLSNGTHLARRFRHHLHFELNQKYADVNGHISREKIFAASQDGKTDFIDKEGMFPDDLYVVHRLDGNDGSRLGWWNFRGLLHMLCVDADGYFNHQNEDSERLEDAMREDFVTTAMNKKHILSMKNDALQLTTAPSTPTDRTKVSVYSARQVDIVRAMDSCSKCKTMLKQLLEDGIDVNDQTLVRWCNYLKGKHVCYNSETDLYIALQNLPNADTTMHLNRIWTLYQQMFDKISETNKTIIEAYALMITSVAALAFMTVILAVSRARNNVKIQEIEDRMDEFEDSLVGETATAERTYTAPRRRQLRAIHHVTPQRPQVSIYNQNNSDIENKISKSFCYISLWANWHGELRCSSKGGIAFNYAGCDFIMPRHYYVLWNEIRKQSETKDVECFLMLSWGENKTYKVFFDNIMWFIPDQKHYTHLNDIVFCRIKRLNMGPDLRKYFINSSDKFVTTGNYLYGPRGARWRIHKDYNMHSINVTHTRLVQITTCMNTENPFTDLPIPEHEFRMVKAFKYNSSTVEGDCGMLLMHTSTGTMHRKIMGMHVAEIGRAHV